MGLDHRPILNGFYIENDPFGKGSVWPRKEFNWKRHGWTLIQAAEIVLLLKLLTWIGV